MAISILLKFVGMKAAESNIKKFNKRLVKRKALNKRIGIKALSEIDKQFKTDGKEFETSWKSLSQTTVTSRKQRGKGKQKSKPTSKFGPTKILRDTGTLKNSFTFKATETKVIVGTATKYSKKHQNGFRRIPQRPILPTDDKVAYEKIAKPVAEDYVKNERKKIFGN